jgi:hypothetical protein
VKEEAENILKYKDIITEIQHMWNLEANVIMIILGATGTISKSIRQYLSNIPGKKERKYKNSHIGHCKNTAGSSLVTIYATCNVVFHVQYVLPLHQ